MTTDTAALRPYSVLTRWWLVVLLMGFSAIGHFNREGMAVAGAEVFIKEKGVTEVQMGWVYTTLLIFYTLGMIPGGWLIDRLGSARVMTLFGLTMGTFVALTGMLGWITGDTYRLWVGLLIIRGLAGISTSPLHPGAAKAVSELMPVYQRPAANGLITAGALVGIACCYPVFGWLMDRWDWQTAFVVCGVIMIGYSLVWRMFAVPVMRVQLITHVTSPSERQTRWTLLANRDLWLISISYGCYGYFQYLFFYWLEYYLKEVLAIPTNDARNAMFYISLAQGVGMVVGGLATEPLSRIMGAIRARRTVVMIGMGFSALFCFIGASLTERSAVTICMGLSMGVLGVCEGVYWTTATDIGGKAGGFVGAFMNTIGNVGGLIAPTMTPYLAQILGGWDKAIYVACGISVVGGLMWFAIDPTNGRGGNQAESLDEQA